ncbi:MAG: hypothetical protein KJ709_08200 [Nanoarchaeota archaeon]|nr:hypothetical protein [Nanoarchaeota archaeon]
MTRYFDVGDGYVRGGMVIGCKPDVGQHNPFFALATRFNPRVLQLPDYDQETLHMIWKQMDTVGEFIFQEKPVSESGSRYVKVASPYNPRNLVAFKDLGQAVGAFVVYGCHGSDRQDVDAVLDEVLYSTSSQELEMDEPAVERLVRLDFIQLVKKRPEELLREFLR